MIINYSTLTGSTATWVSSLPLLLPAAAVTGAIMTGRQPEHEPSDDDHAQIADTTDTADTAPADPASASAVRLGLQAGDGFRGGGECRIAGCRVPSPASLDELDLMRIQAAHGRPGELATWQAGRVRSGDWFGGRV